MSEVFPVGIEKGSSLRKQVLRIRDEYCNMFERLTQIIFDVSACVCVLVWVCM